MGYINQVQKGQEITDIQDIRIPNITNADIGKYLKVKDDLSLEFAEAGGGGSGSLFMTFNINIEDMPNLPTVNLTQEQVDTLIGDSILFIKLYDPNYNASIFLPKTGGGLYNTHFSYMVFGGSAYNSIQEVEGSVDASDRKLEFICTEKIIEA